MMINFYAMLRAFAWRVMCSVPLGDPVHALLVLIEKGW